MKSTVLLTLVLLGFVSLVSADSVTPTFKLSDIRTNKPIDLAKHRGHTVVIQFFSTWAPPCQDSLPAVQAFADQNPDVRVIGVSVDRPDTAVPEIVKFLSTLGVRVPVGRDVYPSPIAKSFGVQMLPATYVLAPDGQVRETLNGANNLSERLTKAVAQIKGAQ